LDLSGGQCSSFVKSHKLGCFKSNAVEVITDEVVHYVHSLFGDSNIRMHLLEHFVDVDREGLLSSSLVFLSFLGFGVLD